MRRLTLVIALLCTSGCAFFGLTTPVDVEHPRVVLPEGIEYEEILQGTGVEAQEGQTVVVDYTAWLADGQHFDSSVDRGVPLRYVLGEAPLLGLDVGLVGLRAGGQRRLFLPPEFAYGAEGVAGLVPPDSAMVFEVELLEVVDE